MTNLKFDPHPLAAFCARRRPEPRCSAPYCDQPAHPDEVDLCDRHREPETMRSAAVVPIRRRGARR